VGWEGSSFVSGETDPKGEHHIFSSLALDSRETDLLPLQPFGQRVSESEEEHRKSQTSRLSDTLLLWSFEF
jgi:hypothetical protein